MRKSAIALLCASLGLAAAGPAWSAVTVTFTNPDNFTDMPRMSADREVVLKDLQKYLQRLSDRLPAGHDLKLEVTDIDLAGQVEPWRVRMSDVRIMRGRADWPRMDVRYTLESNGKVLEQGQAHLSDMAYLTTSNRHWSSDPLRYEKKMIDEWFAKKFLAKK